MHRLDQPTSGIILFAKTKNAASSLSKQFRERLMSKKYISEVSGKVSPTITEIDTKLRPDYDNRPYQVIDEVNGKPCHTLVKILSFNENRNSTLLELVPLTGRTHQLRMHMLAVGHPILGDRLYGNMSKSIGDGENDVLTRLALHASSLSFTHPHTNLEMTISSPLKDFHGSPENSLYVPLPSFDTKKNSYNK